MKFKKFFACFAACILAVGIFFLGYGVKKWTTPRELSAIEDILELIEDNYVGEFDRDEFISAAVRGTLDKYSSYYSPVAYDEVQLNREGISKGRLGISFLSDSCVIYGVSGNSPAERAGIEEGGEVVAVKRADGSGEVPIDSYTSFNQAYEVFEKNEKFTIVIDYGGEQREFTLAKEDFIESYVWYADSNGAYNLVQDGKNWKTEKSKNPPKTQIIEGFSYIKLSSFNGSAAKQIKAALDLMKECGNTSLILDLRSNGGGYMDVLADIAGYLIPGGNRQEVAVAEYKSGREEKFYTRANSYADYGFVSITVLCNGGTASASEALIGAMLDYDEKFNKNIVGVIVTDDGKSAATYGKGIMQTTFTISGGAAIKLTTAKIYWPVSGNCIHGKGITVETDPRVRAVLAGSDGDRELLAAMGI